MLIKEENGKINFIDCNDNFVGFDYQQCGRENFGYHISESPVLLDSCTNLSLQGFCFDTQSEPVYMDNFCASFGFNKDEAVAFRCVDVEGNVLYLNLSNSHNGYYSHGWETSWGNSGAV